MEFNILSRFEGAAVLERDGEKFLAVQSGLRNKSFAGVDTSRLKSLPGLLIDNGEIHNWKIEGVSEINDEIFYYGPYMQGLPLSEVDMTPEILLELTAALYIIKDRKFPVRQFSLSSVFRTENGKILFFPPHLIEFLNSHRKRDNSMKMIEPWNNSKYGGNAGRSFTIAALAYKTITGSIPFPGDTEESIYKLMMKRSYPSPLLSEPLLKDEIVSLIDESFAGKGTLGMWRDLLSSWVKNGPLKSSVQESDKNRISDFIEKGEKSRLRGLKRSAFLFKNRAKLITGAIILVALAAILQAPLSKYLEAPVTMGMTQKEVVELYYSTFKSLDTEVLEDCIDSKAGKSDINEISTIFVTSRVRTSYEGSTGLLDPEQWIQEGMNPVAPGIQVWGLSDLKIKEISADTFQATYYKWSPAIVEDINDTSPRMPVGVKVRDRLHLSIVKEAWKIDKLSRETGR